MPARDSRMPASSSTIRMLCMSEEHWRGRRIRNQRKLYDKARAHRTIFLYANRAMVIFYDAADNRKPKAGSAFLGREIWEKELLFQFSRHAVPSICDGDLNRIAARHQSGADFNLAHHGILRCFGGIVDEIGNCPPDGLVVGHHLGQIGCERFVQADAIEAAVEHRDGALDDLV